MDITVQHIGFIISFLAILRILIHIGKTRSRIDSIQLWVIICIILVSSLKYITETKSSSMISILLNTIFYLLCITLLYFMYKEEQAENKRAR